MTKLDPVQTRRGFLGSLALGAAGAALYFEPGRFAELLAQAPPLVQTPWQTEGPFYPDRLPLDRDNDLVIVGDSTTPAVGAIAHLAGRVLDARGGPLGNALVEIWQVDNNGAYLHAESDNRARRDANFQGYGRFETNRAGEYRFRTIRPVAYPGRAPHIHFAVTARGRDRFTTQCYVSGEPRNERDGLLRSVRDPRARQSLVADFAPLKDSKLGELAARFDIVLA